jgi:hypothetical protein
MADSTAKGTLMERLEAAYSTLLDKSISDTMPVNSTGESAGTLSLNPPVEFTDQVRLLDSAVRFLAIKHRIVPEEIEDGISGFVAELRRGRTAQSGAGGTEGQANGRSAATNGTAHPGADA